MSIVRSRYFGKDIADLLGLKHTRHITIDIALDDVVTVEAEMLLAEEEGDKLTGYIQTRRYKLELIDEDEPVTMRDESGIVETTEMGNEYRQRTVVADA